MEQDTEMIQGYDVNKLGIGRSRRTLKIIEFKINLFCR